MAKAKEPKTAAPRTAKASAGRTPAARTPAGRTPTASRPPDRVAPDTPSRDVIQTGAASGGNGRSPMSPEEIYRLIQETAYYKAKARGFAPGHEVQDWIEAEAEVRLRLDNRAD